MNANAINIIFNEREFTEEFGDYGTLFCEKNKIGSGAYGEVFKCKSKTSNKLFAIKKILGNYDNDMVMNHLKEYEILKSIRHHKNIIPIHQLYLF